MLSKIGEKYGDLLYFVSRVLVGLLFLLHGVQKFTGGQPPTGLFLWAGIFEVLIGPAIILGLFTRLAALLGAIEMAVAYFMVHAPQGANPLANKGEAAILNFTIFLVLLIYGARKWSIDEILAKNAGLKKAL